MTAPHMIEINTARFDIVENRSNKRVVRSLNFLKGS